MPSPSKDGAAPTSANTSHPLHNPVMSDLRPPTSPRTHRALRRLQSAHTLGSSGNRMSHHASLISQQRKEQQHSFPSIVPSSSAAQLDSDNTRAAGDGSATSELSPGPRRPVHSSPQRARANSDATPPLVHQMNALTAAKRPGANKPVFSHGHLTLQQIIKDGPNDGDYIGALESARWKVVDEGVKSAEDGMSTLRIYVWLVLLNAPIMPTDEYLALIHRGASPAYSKIRNDTFRTLTTDPLFRRRVSEASLIRLLNAVAWKLHDANETQRIQDGEPATKSRQSLPRHSFGGSMSGDGKSATSGTEPGTYVQGMNVLAAPFLYAARSEVEAFVAFHTLIRQECPGYIRGAMDGVHRGLALVDKVLAIVDPKLSMYLTSKGLSAEIYAFPSVLTLCACTPPLPEVLKHWDFLFAYGPHLNIVCIVAQLQIMRSQILQSPSPNKLLRSFPQLNAELVRSVTITIIKKIPDDVYAEIVSHAH